MSKILESVLQDASALYSAGLITDEKMQEFESLCTPESNGQDLSIQINEEPLDDLGENE